MGAGRELLPARIRPEDVREGSVGNCYFVASLALLATRRELVEAVFCGDTATREAGETYACRFFRNGEWITVTVDDSVPVKAGSVVYGRCRDDSCMWVSVVEKAYAETYGGYGASSPPPPRPHARFSRPLPAPADILDGGNIGEALRDLTGRPVLSYAVDIGRKQDARSLTADRLNTADSVWSRLQRHSGRGDVIGCAHATKGDGGRAGGAPWPGPERGCPGDQLYASCAGKTWPAL